MNLLYTRTFFLALCCSLITGTSCKKSTEGGIPQVPVNQTINLNLPAYNDLQTVGGWTYISGGSRGIFIYRISVEDFVAMDRHCTYRIADECRVVVPEEGSLVVADTLCCQSEFSIIDGTPVSGDADRPLQRYQTFYNGQELLRISN